VKRLPIANFRLPIPMRLMTLVAVLILLSACGYSNKTLYNKSITTISVPIWKNKTFRRDWEFKLTEALDKDIEARTPFKLVGQGRADTVLTGEITDIQEDVLTRRFGINLPRENELTVVVNFTWRDVRTGKVLLERTRFNRGATEIPELRERVEDAEQLAVERLARAIVDQMQTDWAENAK